MAGDFIPFDTPRYLTPDDVPVGRFCRTFQIPDSPEWVGLVDGAVSVLSDASAWRQSGSLTPEQAADAWQQMLVESWDIAGCPTDANSPFWDDPDAQDADGTPEESSYDYQAAIEDWVITAFLVASGTPGAAVAYQTIAPRFRLYFRTRDYGGIVKILINDVLLGSVDTYSATPGVTFYDVFADKVA